MFTAIGFLNAPVSPLNQEDILIGKLKLPSSVNGIDFVDEQRYELGTRIVPLKDLLVTGVWIYTNNNPGLIVRLWLGDTVVRTINSAAMVAGWNLISVTDYFAPTGADLTVSYTVNTDFFYVTESEFFNSPVNSLQGFYQATGGYFNTTLGSYPADSWNNTFYFVHIQAKKPDYWSISDITSAVYFDADPSTMALDGSNRVLSWTDKNRGLVFDQPTEVRRATFDSGGLDGKPATLHTNHWVQRLNTGLSRNVSGITIVGLVKTADVVLSRYFFAMGVASFGTRFAIGVLNGQLRFGGRRLDTDGFQTRSGGTIAANTTYILSAVMDYSTANLRLRVNGLEVANTSFHTAGNTSNTNSIDAKLGEYVENSWSGAIAKTVYIPEASIDFATHVEGVFAWDFDNTDLLHASHPYKLNRPIKN